jgi:hypothetical protein
MEAQVGLQPSAQAGFPHAGFSTLKMKGILSSETPVHTKSTWRHIPEDGILQYDINLYTGFYIVQDRVQ